MHVSSTKQQAWALYNSDKVDDARQICEQLHKSNAADAETYFLLGSCHGRLGQFKEAVNALHNSLQIKPGEPQSLLALASALTSLGQLEEAVDYYRTLLAIKPKMTKAHCAFADVLRMLGYFTEAREHYEAALKLNSKIAAPFMGLGAIAGYGEGNSAKAQEHFKAAVKLEPDNPACHCSLGMALIETSQHEQARECFENALHLFPDFPEAIAGLARVFSITGEYSKSMQQIEIVRQKNIYNVTAAISFTMICRHLGNCEQAISYGEKVLTSKSLNKTARESLEMHIARAYDSMGQYDQAWGHFVAGNKLTENPYDTAAHRIRTEKMMQVFNQTGILSFPKSSIDTRRPIFIVGMPRSGTSLVEQIIAAHPEVYGAGELTYISDIRARLMQDMGRDSAWPECIRNLNQKDLDRLAGTYLDQINDLSPSETRVTDKMPHNFFELGLIQMLFPESQVIHCKRDPMDTCLSIYFQNFRDGHEYSRNLYHIGTHYHQYLRLMEHWQRYLSIPVLDVQYEELVQNPEPLVRKMLEHCKLEWHDGCLEFNKVNRFVSTASFDQVRQPMYTKSVNRWRNYEAYLDDLKTGLKQGF